MTDRNTADSTSAAPATARKTSAATNATVEAENVASPKSVIAPPQIVTATMTDQPIRWMRETQPDRSAPSSAPNAGAALRTPNPVGPTWKTSSARTGKSDWGMPKII